MRFGSLPVFRSLAFCLALAIPCLAAGSALAQSVRLLGDFRDWSAYATSDDAGQLCFAMSKPIETEPTPDGYGDAYLYLTDRPGEGVRNELNLVAGYSFGPDTGAVLTVGSHSYTLFTEADAAWLEDASQSDDLAGYIRAGSRLEIEGTTERGIKVKQVFSLSGATAASRAIDAACS